jgi:hypothetical protein
VSRPRTLLRRRCRKARNRAGLNVMMPPSCAKAPNDPLDCVVSEPPEKLIWLLAPVATRAWLPVPFAPLSIRIGVLDRTREAPFSAKAPVILFAVTVPDGGPRVIDEPFAAIVVPNPVARRPICPAAVAVVVAVVRPQAGGRGTTTQ